MEIDKQILEYQKKHPLPKKYRDSACGHRYPYFLRWYDDFSESGKMIERHCYCFICEKESVFRLHPKHMAMEHMNFGLEKGKKTINEFKNKLPEIINKYKKSIKEEVI